MYKLKILLLAILVISCNQGLKPGDEQPPAKTGISGTIWYQNWPAADSLKNLKLVVFKTYPPLNIVNEVFAGTAVAYPSELNETLPLFVDQSEYIMELPAGKYEYIVVAQQYGNDLFTQWRAVGQFDQTPQDSLPTAIQVLSDSVLRDVNIFVDFDSLPPQPF